MNYALMPVHANAEMTRAAIESVLAQDISTHLFVVLNGATDGSQAYVHSLDPHRVTAISYQPQKGVSYAWNRGLEWVFERSDSAFVINNDVILRSDSHRQLLKDGGEFVTLVSSDDLQCIAPMVEPNPASKRPHPCFSAFLIRRSVWKRVGKFDETMVNFASDGDYHLRMHRTGIEAYCIDLPFYHRASGTLKSLPDDERDVILALADKDRQAFEAKWGFRMGSKEYYESFGVEPPSDPGAARE